MFSPDFSCRFYRNPLAQVICQFRFPEILSISANAPVDFQEAIRDSYPQYLRKQDATPPKITGNPGNFAIENPPVTINHQFSSADGKWCVNLTGKFVSLTCVQYGGWDEFAGRLDKILSSFISIYRPAYFERIGLRYLNFISRSALGLEGVPFAQLIAPCYLGVLGEEDVSEASTTRSTVDAEMALRGGCRVKIHAGPGMVKLGNNSDKEVKFVLDQDLYMPGQIAINLSAGALQSLHIQANAIFLGAITDTLRDALESNG